MNHPAKVFVTDFDGTMTDQDFYSLVAQRLPSSFPDLWLDYRSGTLTHFEALRQYFLTLRCSKVEIDLILNQMKLDDRAQESAKRLNEAGWHIVVASAGCHWYIDRILSRAKMQLEVHANPGHFDPESGLHMELPTSSPFFSPSHGINKQAIVTHYAASGALVAFAGDGLPDIDAASAVDSKRRFARRDLAQALSQQGLPFQNFTHWSDAVDKILEMPE